MQLRFKRKYYKFLIFVLLAFILVIVVKMALGDKKRQVFLRNSVFCRRDNDCQLYNCVNCGNKLWAKENNAVVGGCENKVPGLIGCRCVDNVCKRKYKK